MASKPIFQASILLLCCIAGYQLWLVVDALFYSSGIFHADTVRFTMLAPGGAKYHRAGGGGGSAPQRHPLNVSGFGLLIDGCRLQSAAACPAVINDTVTLRFPQPVRTNGYFFVTSLAGPAEADPVNWVVEASADGGSSWAVVGASGRQIRRDGRATFFPELSYPTPPQRGREVAIDGRPPWPWAVKWLLTNAVHVLGLSCCLAASVTGEVESVPGMFASMMAAVALIRVLAAAGYHAGNAHREAAAAWLQICQPAIMGYGIRFSESHLIHYIHLYGIVDIVVRLVTDVFIYTFDWYPFLLYSINSPSIWPMALSFAVRLLRTRAVRRAVHVVSGDVERYGAAWRRIVAHSAAPQELTDLARTVAGLTAGFRAGRARQYNRQLIPGRSPPGSPGGGQRGGGRRRSERVAMCGVTDWGVAIAGSIDLERPVNSLDQLYAQASCLNPILIDKVKAWAAASRGFFPASAATAGAEAGGGGRRRGSVGGAGGPVWYVEAGHGGGQEIRWAKIKSSSRAVEKIVRSYSMDVSRLIDICRQAIVFERAADVTACLAAMSADSDAVLVRIKNRMDLAYDAGLSAGYRDVVVNLRIHTPQTEDLGIETHVCEVQLILRAIAEIKSDEGHQRYVEFRNLRAE